MLFKKKHKLLIEKITYYNKLSNFGLYDYGIASVKSGFVRFRNLEFLRCRFSRVFKKLKKKYFKQKIVVHI